MGSFRVRGELGWGHLGSGVSWVGVRGSVRVRGQLGWGQLGSEVSWVGVSFGLVFC